MSNHVVVGRKEQLTIHHFVSPGAVLGADDSPHLIEKIQVIFLNFSCPVYNHKNQS